MVTPIELSVSRFDFGGYEDEDESIEEAGAMSNEKPANELKVCCLISWSFWCTLTLF